MGTSTRTRKRRAPNYFFQYLKTIQGESARSRHSSESDPQQFRLYKMEREEIGARDYARLTVAKCRAIARSVCKQYGVRDVRVIRKIVPGHFAAQWVTKEGSAECWIHLNPHKGTSTDLLTILHELAHHLHFWLAKKCDEQQAHGPEFMACYISILDTVRFIPRDAMAVVCERRKLKYLMPGPTVSSLRKVINQ